MAEENNERTGPPSAQSPEDGRAAPSRNPSEGLIPTHAEISDQPIPVTDPSENLPIPVGKEFHEDPIPVALEDDDDDPRSNKFSPSHSPRSPPPDYYGGWTGPDSPTSPTGVYATQSPPEDHAAAIRDGALPAPRALSRPSFGKDVDPQVSAAGLLTLPMTIYSTMRGTAAIWDKLLSTIPDLEIAQPSLDVGCGRGKVLLKLAERKRKLATHSGFPIQPAYGIDTFDRTQNQNHHHHSGGGAGGVPATATYQNAAALKLQDDIVLHTADFTRLPFADDTFSVVTSNLALHRLSKAERLATMAEVARVTAPSGWVIIMDFSHAIGDYSEGLKANNWSQVDSEMAGMKVTYWTKPCSVMRARKPPRRDWVRRGTDWSILGAE